MIGNVCPDCRCAIMPPPWGDRYEINGLEFCGTCFEVRHRALLLEINAGTRLGDTGFVIRKADPEFGRRRLFD